MNEERLNLHKYGNLDRYDLEVHTEDLQQRIDKAIEYIEEQSNSNLGKKLHYEAVCKTILILKGEDKE